MSIDKFRSRFNFRPEGSLLVGVERERHLVNTKGEIVPYAKDVLEIINDPVNFGYELSACQVESRVGPIVPGDLIAKLEHNERVLDQAVKALNLSCSHREVAPYDMPLDVYPDPTGRYQKIVKDLPKDILRSACRVIGTHVHIGMPDHESALLVYNQVIDHVDELCKIGDGSNGERIKLYEIMAPDIDPIPYASWEDFHAIACKKGFNEDPRKCWSIIRMSVHGTIEFRMFGTTEDLGKIAFWAWRCRNMCEDILKRSRKVA